jgi:hypothetical protein
MANSGSSSYPWHSCTCRSPGICPGQRFTLSLDWLKGFGGWVRAHNLVGNFHRQWGCTRIQKKKQEPFNQWKSPKMVTWGILSNPRGWHVLW